MLQGVARLDAKTVSELTAALLGDVSVRSLGQAEREAFAALLLSLLQVLYQLRAFCGSGHTFCGSGRHIAFNSDVSWDIIVYMLVL